jgi:hypothetical protein
VRPLRRRRLAAHRLAHRQAHRLRHATVAPTRFGARWVGTRGRC